jgi:hypothetical protein
MCNLLEYQLSNGHAMARVVSHQPHTVEAQIQSQVSQCDTYGQSGTGTGFSQSTVESSYNNFGLYSTLPIMSDIPWYKLICHC